MQSSYIPWKGYFDLINAVDECILYDDAQYTTRDWRNRNRIKTADGVRWLTVPVASAGLRHQRMSDAALADEGWAKKHWRTIQRNYARAPAFSTFAPSLEAAYARSFTRLSVVNRHFIDLCCGWLGIATRISWSADYELEGDRTGRLVNLCRQAGATEYVSGPSARAYLQEDAFASAGISVTYIDYSGYPEYPQQHGPFEHRVSVLDLLLNTGRDAPRYMKTFGVTR